MSPGQVWHHEVAFVAPGNALDRLPSEARARRARLFIEGGASARSRLPVRFDAEWRQGRRRGRAQVELRPAASYATEIVLRLASPRGPFGWLLWRPGRLVAVAAALGTDLSKRMEDRWHPRPPVLRALAGSRPSS